MSEFKGTPWAAVQLYSGRWAIERNDGKVMGYAKTQKCADLYAAAPDLCEALESLMAKGSVLSVLEDDERERYLAALSRAIGQE